MAYCPNCNSPVEDGTKFCANCGAAVTSDVPTAIPVEPPTATPVGSPLQGFSDRVNDPEILAAVKKNRKLAKIFGICIIPLPLLGFVIYSLVSDKMETANAVKYGAIVSLIFLIFVVFSLIKTRAKNSYEGVVTEQKAKERTEKSGEHYRTYTEYITYVKTTDGKKEKIRENDRSESFVYNYTDVGDRLRYHPQFNFPYELYDKSKAPFIRCVSCGKKNPLSADRCEKCNIPLLK
ncbi:MAG: zinc ribbon domain-containing protein [Eubacterium sp.]|nr:zinc ribbon domain-containing protein [Eubacterium sp.]